LGSAQELTAILAADERARALAFEAIDRLAARA
jgi:hypothetical protein